MRNLKTQERLTIIFSIYFFVFILMLGVIFLNMFRFMYTNQLKQDLVHEFAEVTTDHVSTDKAGIFFKKDKNGDTLRTHLFDDGVSALFLNKDKSVIRAYGMFEYKKISEKDKTQLYAHIDTSMKNNKVIESYGLWNNIEYIGLVSPFTYHGKPVGFMVLTKSFERVTAASSSAVSSLVFLGGVGLLGSFIMIYVFTKRSLRPLYEIRKAIEKTDLNKLQKRVQIEGHPDDEFVLLATKFNEMLTRLEDMSLRQKEFIANASHELKTPLTRALSSIDIALLQTEIRRSEMDLVKQDILEIDNLIEKLLLLGKVREGAMPKGQIKINLLMETIQKKLYPELFSKQIALQNDNKLPIIIPLPLEYAQIVFSNIISNAIKYSPEKSVVIVSSRETENSLWEVRVKDTGPGIDPKDREHIFDRFYRSNKARRSQGYGLGLSLVKQICDEYGIIVRVESMVGQGSTFILSFPRI